MANEPTETYSEEETVVRREAALKRMLSSPPKPHEQMKTGQKSPKPKK
jgi:hypothetical protein